SFKGSKTVAALAKTIVGTHYVNPLVQECATDAADAWLRLAWVHHLRAAECAQLQRFEEPFNAEYAAEVSAIDSMLMEVVKNIPGTKRLVRGLYQVIYPKPPDPRPHYRRLGLFDRYEKSLCARRDRALRKMWAYMGAGGAFDAIGQFNQTKPIFPNVFK